MSTDVFSIQCDALDGAKLAGFKGVEGLQRPFEFDLFFTVPVGTDVRGAVGERAMLTADRDDGRGPLCWQGILAGARLLHETAERALYRASLVPKLWVLQQHVRSYVHTKKKIDATIGDTLKDGGLTGGDFQFKTHAAAYPQEEFVCQYRESHLDFVHRWFEREGLYYYFEHGEGAGATDKMVIVDDKAQHGPHAGGTVTIGSSASIAISAPAGEISLTSPSVTVRGASVKVDTPQFAETFSTAHSVGIETFDGAAFATSAVAALKLDYAGIGIEYMGIKIEKAGAHAIDEGAKLDGTALAIAKGAVRLFSVGLVKLG